MGLDFTGVYMYAGQGFLVRKASPVHSIADLDGATICVAQGTTLEQNLADYFRTHRLRYKAVTFANIERGLDAYQADRCDAFTNEVTSLGGRLRELEHPEQHRILPGVISREPFAAIVRQGDPRWRDIVRWSWSPAAICSSSSRSSLPGSRSSCIVSRKWVINRLPKERVKGGLDRLTTILRRPGDRGA